MRGKFLIFCFLILIVLGLGGCKKVYVQDGDSKLVMSNNNLSESDSLADLLVRSQNVANIRYDVVGVDGVIAQKFWLQGKKFRIEAQNMVTIMKPDDHVMYVYNPVDNSALEMSLGLGQQKESSIKDNLAELDMYRPEVIGSEVIDEKNCLIIQYQWGSTTTKQWLWKKYGLPVKIETNDGQNKTVINYNNFDFSPIPDSMFELPKDVQITDRRNLPDLKDFNLPEIK